MVIRPIARIGDLADRLRTSAETAARITTLVVTRVEAVPRFPQSVRPGLSERVCDKVISFALDEDFPL